MSFRSHAFEEAATTWHIVRQIDFLHRSILRRPRMGMWLRPRPGGWKQTKCPSWKHQSWKSKTLQDYQRLRSIHLINMAFLFDHERGILTQGCFQSWKTLSSKRFNGWCIEDLLHEWFTNISHIPSQHNHCHWSGNANTGNCSIWASFKNWLTSKKIF